MYHNSLRNVVRNMRHHGLTIRNIALFVRVAKHRLPLAKRPKNNFQRGTR